MEDKKGFCKIFDISVPDIEHFDYYITQLSKLHKFKNLPNLIKLYEEAETKIGNLYEFRLRKSDEIIKFIQETRAYSDLNLDNLIKDLPTSKTFQYEEGKKYLSIDMRKANWTVIKSYDPPFLNELPNTYDDLLDKFDMPDVFKESKSLRQYIFGNINPKRQVKAQRVIIQGMIDTLSDKNITLECIKHDEVIYSYEDINYVKSDILPLIDINRFKVKLFFIKRVEDFRIDNIMNESGDVTFRDVVGCNGNKFFHLIKKYILEEPIDIRDLYFRVDGNLAIWKVDNLKLSI